LTKNLIFSKDLQVARFFRATHCRLFNTAKRNGRLH